MPIPNQTKLTLADCYRIQRDFKEVGAAALARRHNVSRQTIYKAVSGKHPEQLRVLAGGNEDAVVAAGLPARQGDCPVCGLPTGTPCLVCAANKNVRDVPI